MRSASNLISSQNRGAQIQPKEMPIKQYGTESGTGHLGKNVKRDENKRSETQGIDAFINDGRSHKEKGRPHPDRNQFPNDRLVQTTGSHKSAASQARNDGKDNLKRDSVPRSYASTHETVR